MGSLLDHMAAMRARLGRFADEQDQEALFAPDADEDAARLAKAMVQHGPAGERQVYGPALELLVQFHLARDETRPEPTHTDLGAAVRLMVVAVAIMGKTALAQQYREIIANLKNDAVRLSGEAGYLLNMYETDRDANKVDAAIIRYRTALNITMEPGPDRTLLIAKLSSATMFRFEHHREPADLELAITIRREALALTPSDDPQRPLRLSLLAEMLVKRCEMSESEEDLQSAIRASRDALEATPNGDSHIPMRAARYARLLAKDFTNTENLSQLDEAIRVGRMAVDSTTDDDPDIGMYVQDVAAWLFDRADRTGDASDLDTAIALRRRVLAKAEGEIRLMRLTSLGVALFYRYERNGDLADLDEAVEIERLALADTPAGHASRGLRLTNLATSLRIRYEWRHRMSDLDEAIVLGTDAMQEEGDQASGLTLSNLSASFLYRFQRLLEPADLDRAVSLADRAAEHCPPGDPDRGIVLATLANVHIFRLREQDDASISDELIGWHREAVAATPSHDPHSLLHLNNLANHLVTKGALSEAEALLRDALEASSPEHPFRYLIVVGLARVAAEVADRGGSEADLDHALAAVRDLASATDAPPFACRRLGELLDGRYRRRGDRDDLVEAVQWWEKAALTSGAPVDERMAAATSWGRAAFELGDVESAANGYEAAMRLLPQLAWHGLTWNARQKHLVDWSGVAGEAAAAVLAAGRPTRAVEILEEGRAVIWNQLLRIRSDLSLLDSVAPDLARRLRETRELLNALGMADDGNLASISGDRLLTPSAREQRVQEQVRLTNQWDELVAEINRIPEVRHLFAPAPFTDLAAAAADGPVVLINVSALGCQALVLATPDSGVDVVELPDLTLRNTMEHTVVFLNVLLRSQRPGRPFIDRERDRHEVFDLLAWMWDTICVPIFDRLGLTESNPAPPRLWLCPTNVLALLPLHAAGRYPRHNGDDTGSAGAAVPDRVVPSYTPTLTALLRSRERPRRSGELRQLAVGMPATPGLAMLPGVTQELEMLTRHFPEPACRQLVGAAATRADVLQALANYPWVHFACHAVQDLMHPGAGSFALADGPLQLLELAELALPDPELAYLSACETATGGAQLPDEAVHLAAAMQLLGYRHVLATMWHIADNSAVEIATRVYDQLNGPPAPDADRAAQALHKAIATLRSTHPTDPLRWAPYVHLGP
jgi:tetratricopeptide (TPR) repeat protein